MNNTVKEGRTNMVFTEFLFELYRNIKCNEKNLIKNFPGRPFEPVNVADYELAILCGKVGDVYKDMYIINSWVMSKYGKKRQTEAGLDERGRQMLSVIRGLINTKTISEPEDEQVHGIERARATEGEIIAADEQFAYLGHPDQLNPIDNSDEEKTDCPICLVEGLKYCVHKFIPTTSINRE